MKTRLHNEVKKLSKLKQEIIIRNIGPAQYYYSVLGKVPENPKVMKIINKLTSFYDEAVALHCIPSLPDGVIEEVDD